MACVKRFGLVKVAALGLGLMSTTFLGGCSSDEVPVQTEAQKAVQQKEVEDQTSANDAASKSGSTGQRRVGVMPP